MEEGKTSYFSSLYPIFARLAATINSGRVSFRRVKFSMSCAGGGGGGLTTLRIQRGRV